MTTTGAALPLLLSGLPGPMAAAVAERALQTPGIDVLPVALTSDARHETRYRLGDRVIHLLARNRAPIDTPPGTIAVDYSAPAAALDNAAWFVERNLPFVMGTTGFDAARLEGVLSGSSVAAVAAPNMAGPIVLLQAALRWLADEFRGACGETQLAVRESHQQAKRDTSGTARALVRSFRQLGIDFDEGCIEALRDPERQRAELGVPAAFLDAHAYHRYRLVAAGGSVRLTLEHNVIGRRVYADGTLLAVRFLRARIAEGAAGRLFNMEDVLRGVT